MSSNSILCMKHLSDNFFLNVTQITNNWVGKNPEGMCHKIQYKNDVVTANTLQIKYLCLITINLDMVPTNVHQIGS